MTFALAALLDLYRAALRPFLPPACRFHPTCGDYAREALVRHGWARGGLLAAGRLLRCRPLAAWGHDPVPAVPSFFRS